MTTFDWVCFIAFTIAINVIFQKMAWEIAYKIGEKQRKGKKHEDS